MKTAYTILDPGPAGDKLITLEWVDVEFKTDQPSYRDFERLLLPLFNPGDSGHRDFERVAVNSFAGPSDMFVDDMGVADGQEVNEAATLIYWCATILNEMARAGGIETAEEYQHRHVEALKEAARRFAVGDKMPKIYGRVVLFRDRVWF